jgi:hypothetical protein
MSTTSVAIVSCKTASPGWARLSGFTKFGLTPGGGASAGPSRIASITDGFMMGRVWRAYACLDSNGVVSILTREEISSRRKRKRQDVKITGGRCETYAGLVYCTCWNKWAVWGDTKPKAWVDFPTRWYPCHIKSFTVPKAPHRTAGFQALESSKKTGSCSCGSGSLIGN